jgi:glucuronosyltransferase
LKTNNQVTCVPTISFNLFPGYIPSSLSPNIKAVDWLPQNDLLAHNKLKAFVSHVGLNSLYETLYRGVPVVALPLFGDQPDNAALIVERGLGLKLDYKSLTADDLYNTIQRVIQEPRSGLFIL